MSARNSRAGKEARREAPPGVGPPVLLDLVDYLVVHWRVTRRQARLWLFGGRVNVNGAVYAYPEIRRSNIGHDELGRLRIMVEDVPDPRPPTATLL